MQLKFLLVSVIFFLFSCQESREEFIIRNSKEFINEILDENYDNAIKFISNDYFEVAGMSRLEVISQMKFFHDKMKKGNFKINKYRFQNSNSTICFYSGYLTFYVDFSHDKKNKKIESFFLIGEN